MTVPIHVPCDDSVVRVVDHRRVADPPVPWLCAAARSTSGLARGPAVLAVGGELKNTFCLTDGSRAYLSGHIGDMATWETLRAFERAVGQLSEIRGAAGAIGRRSASRVSHPRLGRAPRGRSTAGSGSAPPRARGVAAGRARAHRRTHRRGLLRRHRLRLRPNDLGRRDSHSSGATATASSGSAICCRYRCRAATRRCAIRGGWRCLSCGWPTSTGRRIWRRSLRRRRTNCGSFVPNWRAAPAACRVRAWAGCSTRSPRCWACDTGSTTKGQAAIELEALAESIGDTTRPVAAAHGATPTG